MVLFPFRVADEIRNTILLVPCSVTVLACFPVNLTKKKADAYGYCERRLNFNLELLVAKRRVFMVYISQLNSE